MSLADAFLARFRPAAPAEPLDRFADRLRLPEVELDLSAWDWRGHPMQRALIELAQRFSRLVLLGPAQDGKSVAVSALALYELTQRRRPVVYAATDRGLGATLYRAKIRPMAIRSGLGEELPQEGPGSGLGVPREIQFAGGQYLYLLGAGAQNGAGQAAVTAATVLIDEAGKIRPAQLAWLQDRARSYPDARVVLFGTLEKDHEDQLVAHYEASTAARLLYPCGQCGAWFALRWSLVRYDAADDHAAAATARMHCPACDAAHDDAQRRDLLYRGRLIHRGQTIRGPSDSPEISGEVPRLTTAGLRWCGLDSPIRDLGRLAIEHRRAARMAESGESTEPLRQFLHMEMVEQVATSPDRVDLHEPTLVAIANASDYSAGRAPDDAERAVLAVDVQRRVHYWLVVAEGPRGWAICDWGTDQVCTPTEMPSERQRHDSLARLHALCRDGILTASGRRVPMSGVIDSNYLPEEIRPWIARVGARTWIAAKGQGEELASRMVRAPTGQRLVYRQGWFDLRAQPESPDRVQLFVDDDAILDRIAADWAAGRGRLPKEIDGGLLKHLTGKRPGIKKRWEDRRVRHDWLDALVYALARFAQLSAVRTAPTTSAQDYAASIASS